MGLTSSSQRNKDGDDTASSGAEGGDGTGVSNGATTATCGSGSSSSSTSSQNNNNNDNNSNQGVGEACNLDDSNNNNNLDRDFTPLQEGDSTPDNPRLHHSTSLDSWSNSYIYFPLCLSLISLITLISSTFSHSLYPLQTTNRRFNPRQHHSTSLHRCCKLHHQWR